MTDMRIWQFTDRDAAPDDRDEGTRWIAAESEEDAIEEGRIVGWWSDGVEVNPGHTHPTNLEELFAMGCDAVIHNGLVTYKR